MKDKAKDAMMVRSHDVSCDDAYVEWLSGLKQSYRTAQIKAVVRTNSERLSWNWNMGRDLVMRKAEERWGSGIVEQVSLDLRAEFPSEKGFSADNLLAMKRWYIFYADRLTREKLEKLSQEIQLSDFHVEEKLEKPSQVLADDAQGIPFPTVFALIPWWHHVIITRSCHSVEEALFYVRQTIVNGWSGAVLQRSISRNSCQQSNA